MVIFDQTWSREKFVQEFMQGALKVNIFVLIKCTSSVAIIHFHQNFILPILDLSFRDSIFSRATACSCQEHGDSGFQPIVQRHSKATSNRFFK